MACQGELDISNKISK